MLYNSIVEREKARQRTKPIDKIRFLHKNKNRDKIKAQTKTSNNNRSILTDNYNMVVLTDKKMLVEPQIMTTQYRAF